MAKLNNVDLREAKLTGLIVISDGLSISKTLMQGIDLTGVPIEKWTMNVVDLTGAKLTEQQKNNLCARPERDTYYSGDSLLCSVTTPPASVKTGNSRLDQLYSELTRLSAEVERIASTVLKLNSGVPISREFQTSIDRADQDIAVLGADLAQLEGVQTKLEAPKSDEFFKLLTEFGAEISKLEARWKKVQATFPLKPTPITGAQSRLENLMNLNDLRILSERLCLDQTTEFDNDLRTAIGWFQDATGGPYNKYHFWHGGIRHTP